MKDYFDFEPAERMRINMYLESIFKYGFITLCYLISQYEEEEEYRECELVLHAMSHHKSCYSHDMPTKYNKEAIQALKDELVKFQLEGTTIINNLPVYAGEIRSKIAHYCV